MLPNFLIIGSAKCATTSLHFYLNQHPDIFLPSKKECHYFCHEDVNKSLYDQQYQPISSMENYQAQFTCDPNTTAIGEASPMYSYYPEVAKRIHQTIPKVKLIAILRNPADRAFSAYVHLLRDGLETLEFKDALATEEERMQSGEYEALFAYKHWGYYYERLKPYYDLFDRDQIAVFSFEELKQDFPKVLCECCRHLSVDDSFSFDIKPRMNVSGVPKNRWLHNQVQRFKGDHWFVNLVKKPIPLNTWIRMVKWVEYRNFTKPKITAEMRCQLLNQYRDDIDALSTLVGKDFAALWSQEAAQLRAQC